MHIKVWSSDAKCTYQSVWTWICVRSVCAQPSYNYKNPLSVFFFIPVLKSPFSNQAVLRVLSEWCRSAQAPPTIVDWQDRLTLDPPWVNWVSCKQSDRHSVDSGAGEDKMSQNKRLGYFIVECNNEYSSHHLLPTSEPLKIQRINVTFAIKWIRRSPICLNAPISMWIIRDPASSTEEVLRFCMIFCK